MKEKCKENLLKLIHKIEISKYYTISTIFFL